MLLNGCPAQKQLILEGTENNSTVVQGASATSQAGNA